MATIIQSLTRPPTNGDPRSHTRHLAVGLALGFVGVLLVTIAFVGNLVAGGTSNESSAAQILAWTFGLTTLGFGMVKFGIAVILIGILIRLWLRVDGMEEALPRLQAPGGTRLPAGRTVKTEYGTAETTTTVPKLLPIHRMARTMWAPMLAMGAMALVIGFITSLVWSSRAGTGDSTVAIAAWTQGLQFLGEGMLLSGISFLLGSILASLREGGGRVQQSLGLTVQTLKMPLAAKVFVALMMVGLMVSVAQFVLYLFVAAGVSNPAAWFAWLGPFRELGLGLILAGIAMSLATIANVLGFQFKRIREIVTTGS